MIKVKCVTCSKELSRSPSKVEPRNFCSRDCYSNTRDKELLERGKPFQITPERYKELRDVMAKAHKEKTTGEMNYAWKGENVSYRGLHQWIRRKKGLPRKCMHCGKTSDKPRVIQWANIDGRYRRNPDDFVALCCSCHKYHDINLRRPTTLGSPSAIRQRS